MVKRLWAYLSEKEGRYFFLGVLAFFIVGWFLFFFLLLPAITRHGDEYVLPSLIGRNYHKVHEALEKAGFQPVVIDSQYVPNKAPWTILLQEPPPKSRVKKGRKLYLTVASSTPPQVPLPRVEELPYEQAYRLLRETYGFQLGEVVYVAGDVPDIVVEVRYEGRKVSAGAPVPKYAKLTLVVSRGLSDQKVPFVSVVGLPVPVGMDCCMGSAVRISGSPSGAAGVVGIASGDVSALDASTGGLALALRGLGA
jgi:beta-lactam-binding protein with PASTA domain